MNKYDSTTTSKAGLVAGSRIVDSRANSQILNAYAGGTVIAVRQPGTLSKDDNSKGLLLVKGSRSGNKWYPLGDHTGSYVIKTQAIAGMEFSLAGYFYVGNARHLAGMLRAVSYTKLTYPWLIQDAMSRTDDADEAAQLVMDAAREILEGHGREPLVFAEGLKEELRDIISGKHKQV